MTVAPPAVPAPAAAAAAVRQLPPAPVVVRHAVKAVRAEAPVAIDLDDAAYAAKLQADLCQARQIFCGLDRSGHYSAG